MRVELAAVEGVERRLTFALAFAHGAGLVGTPDGHHCLGCGNWCAPWGSRGHCCPPPGGLDAVVVLEAATDWDRFARADGAGLNGWRVRPKAFACCPCCDAVCRITHDWPCPTHGLGGR